MEIQRDANGTLMPSGYDITGGTAHGEQSPCLSQITETVLCCESYNRKSVPINRL